MAMKISTLIKYLMDFNLLVTEYKGGGTGPAGPVLAGPLFHGGSNILEQTKQNRSMAKNNSIIILDETILQRP